jgi:predicted permease
MAWLRRLLHTVRPSRTHRDIERELSFHLGERADQLRSEGLSDEEALRRARRQLGNPDVHAERIRDVNVAMWADAALRSVRHAARALARTPGFSATVIVTLAVGIGANSAVFSAIDAILVRPLPFPDGDRLVRVRQARDAETPIAPVRLEEWSRESAAFEALSGYYVEDVSDTTGEVPERVRRAVVAPRFLQVWEVAPALGRGFAEAESRAGGPSAVLISDRYWRTRFRSDPGVLARAVSIEGRPHSVVGVMPPSFRVPDPAVDLWWPDPVDGPEMQDTPPNRDLQWYTGIGRLASGVTPEQARADLALVQARLAERHPDTDAGLDVRIVPFKETVVGAVRGSLWLLFGAVTVLLLIACTNIAALLLSRASRREHEVAVRFSLGASRAVVAGQLLAEAALLAVAGAVAGLVVAAGASAGIRLLAPDLPRLGEVGIDGRILLYTMVTAVAVALLCGVLPAVRSTRGAPVLSTTTRTQVSTRHPLQWLLVGVQVALSVTLLAGAGLLLRGVEALSRVDRGFDPAGVLAFRVSGNWGETADRGRLVGRIDGTLEQLRALPGVESVATAWSLPGVPQQYQVEFALAEGRAPSEPPLAAEWRTVSPGYFATLRIPLLSGQACRQTPGGRPSSEVMVNRTFADRYFPGRSVLGLHLAWEAGAQNGRITGVVEAARELGIDRDPAPTVYACDSAPTPFPWFLVRAHGDPLALTGTVRAKLDELEPLRSVYDLVPLAERIGEAYAQNRLRTALLSLFAATALSLACLGVYGTLSYAVSLRRREVGLRLALGAPRSQVVGLLVGRGLRVVAWAGLWGLALSTAFGRLLSGMLYGVSPSDPLTLAGVLGVVLAVGSLAALLPATRAAWIEPVRVLRGD